MKWMQIEFHREFFMIVYYRDETVFHLLFLEKMKRFWKNSLTSSPTLKTCKTSLHKCHGDITCWFINSSCEAWVHSPRFTGFTSNQSTKIRAICEACEPSVKA